MQPFHKLEVLVDVLDSGHYYSRRRKIIPCQGKSVNILGIYLDILEKKEKMVPLLVAFLALPCLGEGADNGLSQLIKEEDKFHLLTEV